MFSNFLSFIKSVTFADCQRWDFLSCFMELKTINLILLIKQFKQFLLNWITNISILTLQPFTANIGRKEGRFLVPASPPATLNLYMLAFIIWLAWF